MQIAIDTVPRHIYVGHCNIPAFEEDAISMASCSDFDIPVGISRLDGSSSSTSYSSSMDTAFQTADDSTTPVVGPTLLVFYVFGILLATVILFA